MIANSLHRDDDVCREGFHQRAFEECDHRAQNKCEVAGSKCKLAFVALVTLVTATAAEPSGDPRWHLLLEPKFMRREVVFEIPHAQRTVLAPAQRSGNEYLFPARQQFAALNLDWSKVRTLAAAGADADLASLEPRYVRDGKKVIRYAELRSDRPIVASAVLSAKFLALFKDTLGDKLLVVVPNRFTAYVFASLASDYQQYAPMVYEAYRATAFPVSVELFELSAEGLKAVGAYEEP
jgi:hypothetical protein